MKILRLQKKYFMIWIAALLLVMPGLPICASAAELSADAVIAVENRITGDTPKKAAKFTFTLEPEEPDFPVPEKGTLLTIAGAGKGEFGAICYKQPGEYAYTVRETTEELSGYTLDTAVYQIKVSVLCDDAGKLYTQMSVTKAGAAAKSGAILFKNKYTAPETKKISPEVPLTPAEAPKAPASSGGGSGNQGKSAAAKTEDESGLPFWCMLLFASGIILIIRGVRSFSAFQKVKKSC